MKTTRKILAFLVAAATILTAACNKTEKKTEEKKSLSVLSESISFDNVGGTKELEVNASSGRRHGPLCKSLIINGNL